jgi:hypothetical protein
MSDADDRTVPRKLADTDGQIHAVRHHVSEECVSIASSIDTILSEMVPHEMRERWLRELRQAAVALVLVVERLAAGLTAEALVWRHHFSEARVFLASSLPEKSTTAPAAVVRALRALSLSPTRM